MGNRHEKGTVHSVENTKVIIKLKQYNITMTTQTSIYLYLWAGQPLKQCVVIGQEHDTRIYVLPLGKSLISMT